ncbi:MAG: SPOR domain-containing protein [Acidobacteriota bacterium]
MSKTYYVIELTPRWLAILLVALAGLLVLAFVGGYGAAWSTLGGSLTARVVPAAEGGDAVAEVEIEDPQGSEVVASVATPDPPKPTVTPVVEAVEPTPTPTPSPEPTATPQPTAIPTAPVVVAPPKAEGFQVQVLASSRIQAIEKARRQLVDVGFPNSEHKVVETRVAGGGILLKLRIGPFPDHASAERVMRRMQTGGFPDAWVVKP